MRRIAREIRECIREGCLNTFEVRITDFKKYCGSSCSAKCTKNFTGHHHSGKTKQVMREKKLGVPLTEARIQGYKNRKLIPWNKDLTKYDDPRLMKMSLDRQGDGNPMYGWEVSDRTRKLLADARTGFVCSRETREKMSMASAERAMAGIGGNKYYKRGHIVLERLGIRVFYRSSYEKQALLLLDSLTDVKGVSVESIMIEYKDDNHQKHHYVPDYLVTTVDDFSYIIEVKSKWNVSDKVNQLKFTAAREYAKRHNMVFLVWTEEVLFNDNSVETTLVEVIQSATAAIPNRDDEIVRTA